MIGYLEDMTCEEIFQEVNAGIEQVKGTLPPQTKISPLLFPQTGWQDKATSRLTHQLRRLFLNLPSLSGISGWTCVTAIPVHAKTLLERANP